MIDNSMLFHMENGFVVEQKLTFVAKKINIGTERLWLEQKIYSYASIH